MSDDLPEAQSPPASGTVELPPGATPYLLVMPHQGDVPANAVLAPDGWALPVAVPAGTPGYAIFVPLIPTVPAARDEADPTADRPASADDQPARADEEAAPAVDSEPAQPAPFALVESQPEPLAPTVVTPAQPVVTHQPEPEPAAIAFRTYSPQPYVPWLKRRWPGPAPATGWTTPTAVVVSALAAAIFTPLNRTGIGWVLAGLIMAVALTVAVRRRTNTSSTTEASSTAEISSTAGTRNTAEQWTSAGWTVAALLLLAVPTFRNAWWLVTFCVLGALACAALAIVGGRRVRSMLYSLVAAPFAALRGLPWVTRHLRSPRSGTARVGAAVWSVVVTVIVVLLFGTLLRSADAAFSRVLEDLIPEINAGTVVAWTFLFVTGGLIAVAAVYTLSAPPDLSTMDAEGRRALRTGEWGLPIAALIVLFGGFVAVQFTVLFGGDRHVLETARLNYADYARSGFWQLAAVTVLTLVVLAAVTRWAGRERRSERLALRILLGLLCGLSIVIVVSALYRMYTYQQAYSFTGERIFVMGFELMLGSIFLLIMAAGIRLRGAWVPQLSATLGVVLLLSLAVFNPEDYAAQRNIDRYQASGKIDAWYLRALSADATPALTELPDPVRRCALSWIADKLKEPDPWYAWNLGRAQAREALRQLPPGAVGGPGDCRAADAYDFPKTR